jgi:translation elongation factor P/translation initiation factor 5A
MEKGVALLQWDPAEELTGEAKTKFTDNEIFPIWFNNGETIIMRMPDK